MTDFRQQVEARIKVLEAELDDLKRIKSRWISGSNDASPPAPPAGDDGNVTALIHSLVKGASPSTIMKDDIKKRVRETEKFKDYDGRRIHFAILNLSNRGKIEEKKKDEWKFVKD